MFVEARDPGFGQVRASGYTDASGRFQFRAWADNPQFTVWLVAKFEGFGVKSIFEMKRNDGAPDSTAELIYIPASFRFEVDANNQINYVSPFPPTRTAGSTEELYASPIFTFHGMREILRLATDHLGIELTGTFNVFYACVDASGNMLGSFVGNDHFGDGAYIERDDQEDWDTLAHEFGHKVDNDNNAIDGVGGPHDGSNQYTYSGGMFSSFTIRTILSGRLSEQRICRILGCEPA